MNHTVEIIRKLTWTSEAIDIAEAFSFSAYKIDMIRNHVTCKGQPYSAVSDSNIYKSFPGSGIKQIRFLQMRNRTYSNLWDCYVIMKIELNNMLTGEKDLQLYCATPEDNELLCRRFSSFMTSLGLCRDHINELPSWNAHRVDYTQDLFMENPEQKRLFLKLLRRTTVYSRNNRSLNINDIPLDKQSVSEINKSYKTMFYDKEKQIRETYGGMPHKKLNKLIADAALIVRFEVACKKSKLRTIKEREHLPSMSIMGFLDERIAYKLLWHRYIETVGKGDFFIASRACSLIKGSEIKTNTQKKLINYMRAIADCRSISTAQAATKAGYKLKGTDTVVKIATDATFLRYRTILAEELNLNAVTIPKDWGFKELRNPIWQIEAAMPLEAPLDDAATDNEESEKLEIIEDSPSIVDSNVVDEEHSDDVVYLFWILLPKHTLMPFTTEGNDYGASVPGIYHTMWLARQESGP